MERFWSKVEKTGGCWNWTSCTSEKGYGLFSIKNRNRRAHRVSYEMSIGPIPPGMQVLHRCDNPGCVNPDHLFVGTGADNMADKVAKGRQAHVGPVWGEQHPHAKLTNEQVLAIRAATGSISEISRRFRMTWGHIADIRARKAWKHI